MKQLEDCSDFDGVVRRSIEPVLISTILFLARCQDIQEGGATRRTVYLYRPDASERDLQGDLMDWYKGNLLTYRVAIEVQHIGGGRIDLGFLYTSCRFVIELKCERSNSTRASIGTHLRQAATYQATDIAVGMLVVLDTSSDQAPAHMRDNVWVDRVPSPEPGGTDRFVLVVRIPGNRRAPSRLSSIRDS